MDTPAEVAKILTEQADDIQRKIQSLSKAHEEIELLKTEVLQMQSVDFKKYAAIIVNLQMKNEFYFLIKHFDEQTLDHIRNRFDMESSTSFMNNFSLLNNKILDLQKDNVPPNSEAAQSLAKTFWDMVLDFTQGDMSMLRSLMKTRTMNGNTTEWGKKQALVNTYIEKALDVYFTNLGVDPFAEESK